MENNKNESALSPEANEQQKHAIEVIRTKQIRKEIDLCIQNVKALKFSRETSLAITKLQEAVMWLGMNLKQLGESNPYPDSYNPENTKIEPTADGLKF